MLRDLSSGLEVYVLVKLADPPHAGTGSCLEYTDSEGAFKQTMSRQNGSFDDANGMSQRSSL